MIADRVSSAETTCVTTVPSLPYVLACKLNLNPKLDCTDVRQCILCDLTYLSRCKCMLESRWDTQVDTQTPLCGMCMCMSEEHSITCEIQQAQCVYCIVSPPRQHLHLYQAEENTHTQTNEVIRFDQKLLAEKETLYFFIL